VSQDLLALAPEIALLAGAVVTLLVGSFSPRARLGRTQLVVVLALVVDGVFAGYGLSQPPQAIMAGAFTVDAATGVTRLIVAGSVLLVAWLGADELAGEPRRAEALVLALLSALGAQVLAGAGDLAVLAVGCVLSSVALVGLVGLVRTRLAPEAAMKTYFLSSLLGIVLLGGVTLLTGLSGSSRYDALATSAPSLPGVLVVLGVVAVLAGLLVEVGGVPGHFWVPDVAQGASATAAAFATTVPKIGALVALWRLVDTVGASAEGPVLVGIVAAVTMTLGNLAAYPQRDPRRLLGWSTVSQAGYLLVPVAVAGASTLARPALLYYLAAYAVSNLGAFAVTAAVPARRTLGDYRGLGRRHPWLAGALLVCLLSLVGTPPTAVFVGKLTAFTAGWDGRAAWLVLVAAVNTVVSLFYYLRWLMPVFRTEPGPAAPVGPGEGRADRDEWRSHSGEQVAQTEPAVSVQETGPLEAAAPHALAAAVASAGVVLAFGLAGGLVWPLLAGP
jgi:NADH-quinone oxidoreductase subunit N